jgi:hypothetical protein
MGKLIGIDLDIEDADLVAQAKQLAFDILGPTDFIRIGKPPRLMLCYRTNDVIPKIITSKYLDVKGVEHRVEVYGRGSQIGAYGKHSDAHQYTWPEKSLVDYPIGVLPSIESGDAALFKTRAEALFVRTGLTKVNTSPDNGNGKARIHSNSTYDVIEDLTDDTVINGYSVAAIRESNLAFRCASPFREDSSNATSLQVTVEDGQVIVSDHPAGVTHIESSEAREARERAVIANMADAMGKLVGGAETAPSAAITADTVPMESSSSVFGPDAPIGLDRLTRTPLPPAVLLPGIIPTNVFGMVGPGGSSKTTMMLYIMIHIILGREIWRRKPTRSGPCVFVSAEDDMETMAYRIHRLCNGLHLNDVEMAQVAENLYIHDISGDIVRFVEADPHGNLTQTEHLADLRLRYIARDIALMVFDPAVFFGAGERFVNDAEATLMQAGRRLSKALECAVGFIHHTSKLVAREKVVDQYAGRGGGAFADNSRALLVLHLLTKEGMKNTPPPDEVSLKAVEQHRAAYLTVAKFSAGKLPELPFWWLRDEFDGFAFDTIEGVYVSPAERDKAKIIADNSDSLALMTALYDAVKEARDAGKYPTKTYLKEVADIIVRNKKMAKLRIGTALEKCIVNGFLAEEELPESEKRGARKTYIEVIKRPTSGHNQEGVLLFRQPDSAE